MELYQMTPLEIGEKLKEKDCSVQEVADTFCQRIEKYNKEIGAFVRSDKGYTDEIAAGAQAKIDAGEATSPLAGVPFGIKDNMCIKGQETTCCSKILSGFKPVYNSTVYKKAQEAAAVYCGKANMDEFAMGSTSETSFYGVTKNPFDLNRVPGGSSGGSAAAVAAGLVPYALGSDTGGSIRQPAAYCGVTGFKPTYGTVSRYGLIAYGSSLDQIGPIAPSVKDCAAVMDIIGGYDEMDATSTPTKGDYLKNLNGNLKGVKIGVPTSYFGDGLNDEVKTSIYKAIDVFRSSGAEVEEFELPNLEYAVPAYYIIASAEASSNLSRFDGVKYGFRSDNVKGLKDVYLKTRTEGFGTEVKKRIMLGAFVLSSGYFDAYYMKALKVKAVIRQSLDEAFTKYDAILGPVAPTTAPVIGESLKDPLAMYLSDIYTVSANLAGLPGLSIPCGSDSNGMPIGMQLLGKAFDDRKLLNIGYGWQEATSYRFELPESYR